MESLQEGMWAEVLYFHWKVDKLSKSTINAEQKYKRIVSEWLRAKYDTLCDELWTTVSVMNKCTMQIANLEAMIGKTASALKRLDIDVDD